MKTQISKASHGLVKYSEEYKQQALELWRKSGCKTKAKRRVRQGRRRRFSGYSVARMSSRVTPLATATSRRMAWSVPIRSGLWSGIETR
jgi:hypothetical protein